MQISSSLWSLSRRRFYPQEKIKSQECQKWILGVLRNDWVIKFFRRTSRLSDQFRTLGRKARISDFFPSELWKLHFSWPGNILKRNNLPGKQSCSFFGVWTAKNSDFIRITSTGLSKVCFACPEGQFDEKISV